MTSTLQPIERLLSQMTLDEKLAQLGSCWIYELQTCGKLDPDKFQTRLSLGIGQISRVAGASTLEPMAAARAGNQIQKFLVEETRLGIPAILHEESCSGTMVLGGTMYPQMLGLAATFQPELAERMTSTIRQQMLAIGARQALGPVLDVARDPRWGRTEETFGEDPLLVSQFGTAYIHGLQGEDLADGVMATGKHFIGHSLSQGGLNCGPVHVGWHEMYEVLLAPFQAAIQDAGLASIMNAYPEVDGELVAASRRILTELLREKLGFDGLVVSDYEAVVMIHSFHNVAGDRSEAGRLALAAGIDVELPTTVCYGEPLMAAVQAGDLDIETLDAALRRHLQKKIELGLFDQPYVDEGRVSEVFETSEQRKLARDIACQSMVLLKNNGLLPLRKDIGTLAVLGPNADHARSLLGDYSFSATMELMIFQSPANSSFVNVDTSAVSKHQIQVVSVLEAIKAAVSPNTQVLHARGCDNLDGDISGFDEACEIAQRADAVILVLGDRSGLTPECTTGETRDSAHLRLPGVQEDLVKAVLAIGKPVAAVLISGRPYAIPWLDEKADAVLEAWIPGEEGGTAVADVLFGHVNPGGKTPVTFPRHVGQLPIFYNHPPSGMKSHWYGDYVSERTTPLYPFGHGLSYTTFEYSNFSLDRLQATSSESVGVAVEVTNTGLVAGEEVVQLYVRDEFGSSPRPVKQLVGFTRISLQPSERKKITFRLPVALLAFYNRDLELVVEPGRILVMVGSSSEDIRLQGAFEIVGSQAEVIEKRLFACPVELGP